MWTGQATSARILDESQISTANVGTEYDTGKTKITCYYAASFRTWPDQTEWSHNTFHAKIGDLCPIIFLRLTQVTIVRSTRETGDMLHRGILTWPNKDDLIFTTGQCLFTADSLCNLTPNPLSNPSSVSFGLQVWFLFAPCLLWRLAWQSIFGSVG